MYQVRDAVSQRLTDKQETSEDRRRYLQKMARLMCRRYNPTVQFTNIPTAQCRHSDGDIAIDVGKEVTDQSVTNMPKSVWTLVAQEALITHEIGHVLYTDFEAHEDLKDRLGMSEMSVFHDIVWNPAEDAAIEEQLRWKFNCSNMLDVYRANLFSDTKIQNASIPQAVKVAILEKGCYDTGRLKKHFKGDAPLVPPGQKVFFDNTVLPEVESMLADVMTEPDPGTRYERMLDFWDWLKDVMEDEQGEDAVREGRRGSELDDLIPDDTSGMTEGRAADKLEDLDSDEVEDDLQTIGVPEEMLDEMLDDAEDSDSVDSGESPGDQFGDADDSNPSDDRETDEHSGENAESAGDSGGEGSDQGNAGQYPGHEGHTLVIKD